ncbi:MAG TPA: ABC transporter permease [Thermoanaerobaculia bacterium]|nr:ABC transporter permease [Thermoanaerobaculia bacterium]
MNSLFQDIRYALRSFAKAPGFTLTVVATLALGIGANTAIFSVVHGVLVKSLPYRDPDRIVRVGHVRPEGGRLPGTFSPQDFEDLEREKPALSTVSSFQFVAGHTTLSLTGRGEPAQLEACFVSPGFFETLGVVPAAGRPFVAQENTPGRDTVAVLSSRLWTRLFGEEAPASGRTLTVNGAPFTVVGVMPPSFQFPSQQVDLWVPVSQLTEDAVPHRRDVRWLEVVARLKPGATIEQARAGAGVLFARLEREYPDSNRGFGQALVVPLEKSLVGEVRTPLLVLLGAVGLVLLIACANVANLLLARSAARGREIAIRTALGAKPSRLLRQLLTESVLLALLGGAAGLAAAYWGVEGLLALTAGRIPRADEIRPDAAVTAFAAALSVVTGILFGILPARRSLDTAIASALEWGGRGASGSRSDVRRSLVVAETVLAAMLLAGAGLLGKSFWKLIHVPSGVSPQRVLAVSLSIPAWKYSELEKESAYRSEILRRLRALPGVIAAGGSKTMPLSGGGEAYKFRLPGDADPTRFIQPASGTIIVTPGYFAALGIPLLRGRGFTEQDLSTGAAVLLVNQAMARQIWPGEDPVGKAIIIGKIRYEVIGVAGDVRHEGLLSTPGTAVYGPVSHFPRSSLRVFLRTAGDPRALAAPARAAIRALDPDQTISSIEPLTDAVSQSVSRPRFYASLLGIFAALAILMAGSGLYAVLSYGIARRTREIGVRMAMGASTRDVVLMVSREGLATSALGIAVGLLASIAAGRLLAGLLFDVRPFDPPILGAAALFLLAVAAAASAVPAFRASRVDPMTALRAE